MIEKTQTIDSFLWLCSAIAELAVLTLLFRSRACKTLPLFSVYMVWAFLSDIGFYLLSARFSTPHFYTQLFIAETFVDSSLQFAVIVELLWSILRPVRSSLPRASWLVIAGLMLLASAAIWPIAGKTLPGHFSPDTELCFRLLQTVSLLRIGVFLGIAGFSQLLAIGWRDRELQIATGLGFFSFVGLAVDIAHTYQASRSQYHWIDQIRVLGYLSTLSYWVAVLGKKSPERQNFSPPMQGFLLLLGGSSRATRLALADLVSAQTGLLKSRHANSRNPAQNHPVARNKDSE